MAQSEARQDIRDILLQHIQHGTKVSSLDSPELEENELRQEEKTKSVPTEVWRHLDMYRPNRILIYELNSSLGAKKK